MASRADGVRKDYQRVCRSCPDLSTCQYFPQFKKQVSFIAVHDLAPWLVGKYVDRGNIPMVGIFDEDPRRIYSPEIEGFIEDDLRHLDADHPTAAPAITQVLRRGAAQPRDVPRPLVEALDAFRAPTGAARTALTQLVQAKVTGRPRQLINALHSDVSGKRPFRVWLAPPKHPYRAERNKQKVRAVVGVVTVNQFQLHDEVLAIVLDATAHPGLLQTGLNGGSQPRSASRKHRKVIADTDQVAARCELWQIPENTTREVLDPKSDQVKNIGALLRALEGRHSKADPLGLITHRDALQYFPPVVSPTESRVDGYFGGIRGTNVFHDRNVRELVIVGANIPNLTKFRTLSTAFIEQHENRVPSFSTTTRYESCGFKWEGMEVATATMSYQDATMAALLDRECAAEHYQAAYRIRPHVDGEAKRIWLIGTQPFWDLPTTRLLTLEQALREVRPPPIPPVQDRPPKLPAALAHIRDVQRCDNRIPTRAEIAHAIGCCAKTAQRALREYREELASKGAQDKV